jgi:hypothetical protein
MLCRAKSPNGDPINGAEEANGGEYIHRKEDEKKSKAGLVLLAAFAGRVLSLWRRRKTALPLSHKIGGSALEFRGCQLGDSRPGDAFGYAGIRRGGSRIPLAKAADRASASAHDQIVIYKIRKSRNVPSTGSWTTTLRRR